jgi:hypothetical protein
VSPGICKPPIFAGGLIEVLNNPIRPVVIIGISVTLVGLGVGERPLGGKLRGETVLLGERRIGRKTETEKDWRGERQGSTLGRTAGMPNSASISPDVSRGFFMRGFLGEWFIRDAEEITTEAQRHREDGEGEVSADCADDAD